MNPKTSDYQKQQRYQENEILEHAAEILATRSCCSFDYPVNTRYAP